MKNARTVVIEALRALSETEQYDRMYDLIVKLPKHLRQLGRIKTFEMLALMRTERYDEARALMESRIVLTDVREGEVLLTNLWFELVARMERGSASEEDIAWVKENRKPPQNIDFRMV